MLQTANVWLGAAILVGAGLWQLTPLKTMCLRHCRSPLGFLIGNWRAGRLGAMRTCLSPQFRRTFMRDGHQQGVVP
jgi:predicted metal-binding membrane protein